MHTLLLFEHCKWPKYSTRYPSSFQESVSYKELVWPARFYSCSLCPRGFRSSQVLGGHMNVHRRDRAKLKQLQHSQSSPMQKDSAVFLVFRGDLQMFPSFLSAGDHEIIKKLFKHSELLDDTAVSCKRIRRSDRNSPCFRRELFANRKQSSGSMEDVDLELRLGSNPTSLRKKSEFLKPKTSKNRFLRCRVLTCIRT